MLPGSGAVTDRGTSTYSIPLRLPDGINGMQPGLAIAYSGSTTANGHLGVGFGLTGLSYITPCRSSFASDHFADGPDFGVQVGSEPPPINPTRDSYCLDGQKLKPYPSAFNALPDGTGYTFHTEVESYQHVIATQGATDVQPQRFTVYSRDGDRRVYEPVIGTRYQNRDASTTPQPFAKPIAIMYRLTEAIDRNENKIVYEYESSDAKPGTGEVGSRLKTISYVFDAQNVATRLIRFHYGRRGEELVDYRWGVKLVNRSVLNRIEMVAPFDGSPATGGPSGLVTIWSYELEYTMSPDTGRSRLDKVRMRDSTNIESWTRSFGYTAGPPPGTRATSVEIPMEGEFDATAMGYDGSDVWHYHGSEANWIRPNDTRLVLFDLDGDGDDDALYRTRPSDIRPIPGTFAWDLYTGTLTVRMSRGNAPLSKAYDVSRLLEPGLQEADDDNEENHSQANPNIYTLLNLGRTRIGDFNSDGALDLMLARTYVEEGSYYQTIDGNVLVRHAQLWKYGFTTFAGYTNNGFLEPPFTKFPTNAGLDETALKGSIYRITEEGDISFVFRQPSYQRVLGDFDGDGRVDVLDPYAEVDELDTVERPEILEEEPLQGTGYRATLSTTPTETKAAFDQTWVCGNGFATPGDIDGDGRDDVLIAADVESDPGELDPPMDSKGTYRRLSVGDGVPHGAGFRTGTSAVWAGECDGNAADLVHGDFNGDGLPDVLYPPGSYRVKSTADVGPPWIANTEPVVRWNLGTGYGPITLMPIHGVPSSTMRQDVPIGKQGKPVRWDRGTRVADVDGDGRSDIIAIREDLQECVYDVIASGTPPAVPHTDPSCWNHVYVFHSRGDSFFGEEIYNTGRGMANLAHGFTTAQLGDVTGDGSLDLVMVRDKKLIALELPSRVTPDLLQTVSDTSLPAGVVLESFAYWRSWWGADRVRAEEIALSAELPGSCAWPIACLHTGATVVREHKAFAGMENGVATYQTDMHRFAKPRANMTGRGGLGFGTHEIWERERGAWTKRTFSNDKPVGLGTGAYFYPYSMQPDEVIRVVSRSAMASPSQIANSSDLAPGLTARETGVTVTWTSQRYEFPTAPVPNGIIRIRNPYTRVTEVDTTAFLNIGKFPYFTPTEAGSGSRTEITRTYDPDEFDNIKLETTEIRDGFGLGDVTVREVSSMYENRVPTGSTVKWQLGLPTYTAIRSYTKGSGGPKVVTRREFDPNANLTSFKTAVTTSNSCVSESCETVSSTVTFVPDAKGNVRSSTRTATTTTGTQARTTSTTWDPALSLYPVASTDSLGFTTQITMHPWFGTPASRTTIDGVTEATQYDGFGRIRSVSRTGTPSVTRTYAIVQGRLRITDTVDDGSKHYDYYDETGRVVESGQSGFGANPWTYSGTRFDVLGNAIATMIPTFSLQTASWTQSKYDRLGRVLEYTTPDHDSGGQPRTTKYSHGILSSTVTDPRGHIDAITRDPVGRPIQTNQVKDGVAYGTLRFRYGAFDRVDTITDAKDNVRTIAYDNVLRTITENDPDTGRTKLTFDGFGALVEKRLPNGDIIAHEYDRAGRVRKTTRPEGISQRFYDSTNGKGKPWIVTSPDGVNLVYAYDSLGRLTGITQNYDGKSLNITNTYDSLGRISKVAYPEVPNFPRFTIRYDYGIEGQLHKISNVSTCSAPDTCTGSLVWRVDERDPRQLLTKASHGPYALSETRKYGATGRMTDQRMMNAAISYEYDADGLLSRRTDPVRSETFDHDEVHRISGWSVSKSPTTTPYFASAYAYDEIGNLETTKKDGVVTFSAQYGWNGRPHAIRTSTTASTYDYDSNGRQTAAGSRTVEYNSFDLPIEITSSTTTRRYLYDGNGQRVVRFKTAGFSSYTTRYFGREYEWRQPSIGDDTHVFYVYGDGELVAQTERDSNSQTTLYAMVDRLGTPTMFSANGTTVEHQYFDPFGGRVTDTGAATTDSDTTTNRGFTGHEDEDNGGLINMQGRIYDRKQFRFLTPDPIISDPQFGQSYNPYSYVANNPLSYTDPSGFEGEATDTGTGDTGGGGDGPPQTETFTPLPPPPAQIESPSDPSIGGPTGTTPADGQDMTPTIHTTQTTTIEVAAPAEKALKFAWDYSQEAPSDGGRALGYFGVALAAPVASVEMANNAGWTAVLDISKQAYSSFQHMSRAYDLWKKGASDAALDAYLQAREEDAWAAVKAALLVVSAAGVANDNARGMGTRIAQRVWDYARKRGVAAKIRKEVNQNATACRDCGAVVDVYRADHDFALVQQHALYGKGNVVNHNVGPQCATCSNKQGAWMKWWAGQFREFVDYARKGLE